MRVIGTAGHVDHGKSTLVEKLSGINPDRLAEEQSRSMTIDLGFAWMRLPNGETAGIVDVPGHRDFIENMLAGVGGMDAALLVIAADEGIMPQTREHLSILRLLGVSNIAVVLSKTDLIDDDDWMELVILEVEELLAENGLDDSPIVPVSAITGVGLDELTATVQAALNKLPPRLDCSRPRLPVDRVFVISGFGTVVTGTLSGGALSVGDQVEFQPSGQRGRIRGLQSYKQEVETALPGSRAAVNIAGISSSQIRRGDVLTYPGQIRPTVLADAHFRQLADVSRALEHHAEVKFFSGAAESVANVRLLNTDKLAPGGQGWLQIRLRDALPLGRGDRFILRYPSPAQTIGGGVIVNAHPGRRRKRFQPAMIRELEALLAGAPAERLALAARGKAPLRLMELQQRFDSGGEELKAALAAALDKGLLIQMDRQHYWAESSYRELSSRLRAELATYHKENPLRLGILRAELHSKLKVKRSLLDSMIERDDRIVSEWNAVRMKGHQIIFSAKQQAQIDHLMQILNEEPYSPPPIAELNEIAGEDLVRALLDLRHIIMVSDSIAFPKASYDRLDAEIRRQISEHGEIDAKTLRDEFGTSRKYAIAVLEHLDSLGITQRVGDVRRRGRNLG